MKDLPKLLIFDVNETLLDLAPVSSKINETLKSSSAFEIWFSRLLLFSLAESLTGEYRDFGEIGKATLKMTAQRFSADLSEEKMKEILDGIKRLDPYPEVPGALKLLKDAGFQIAALTNGSRQTVDQQLEYAGITSYFDAVYSVDALKKFKPHPATYNYVLEKQNTLPRDAMLIAAHAWDIMGAQRAGVNTGFISRPGKFLYPPGDDPSISGESLKDLVDQLLF